MTGNTRTGGDHATDGVANGQVSRGGEVGIADLAPVAG
jgi:hypothetical protein